MSFEELGLAPTLLSALSDAGFTTPTSVQASAIPQALAGHDLMVSSQTGSGKTAAFMLPALHRIAQQPGNGGVGVQVLVLAPTRELALQVTEATENYGRNLPGLRTATVVGGMPYGAQLKALSRRVDVLVATPGRLLDLLTQGALTLSALEVLVLDEADRMLDMGFITDIRRIMKALPEERQTLLFSATFSNDIKALADDLLKDPTLIEVDPSNTAAEQVSQRIIQVDRERRREMLSHMIGRGNWQRVLVFVRTKQIADRLAQQMQKDGLDTVAIHGDKSQGARNRALADFREGKVRVLVATDIAARGLDIDQLPHVINFELPQMAEDYIHRIGRTGRAGRGGEAISLVSQDELGQLKEIEALIGQSLTVEILEGYEPSGKPSRQTLPGSKPVQNPPRARGHANAKGKPAAGKGKGDGAKKPAQPAQNKSRKREVVGEDIGFAPMRRLPKAQRGDYQDNSSEE